MEKPTKYVIWGGSEDFISSLMVFTDLSTGPHHLNILSRKYPQGIILRNGSKMSKAAMGIRIIVALSSMYRRRGHSEATHSGPKIKASHNGVANQYQHATQMAAMKMLE